MFSELLQLFSGGLVPTFFLCRLEVIQGASVTAVKYTVNSLKADTTLRGTWLAGPDRIKFLLFFCNETLYKADTSLRRTARAGPEGVRLRESSLYVFCPIFFLNNLSNT